MLLSGAQQRVLQQLPPAAAKEAQQLWEEAAKAAFNLAAADGAALSTPRNPAALAESWPLAVAPEWISSCWAEARRVPADSAHGLVEVIISCIIFGISVQLLRVCRAVASFST